MTSFTPSSAPAPRGVLEASLYVNDLAAAATFYGDVLGFEEVVRVEGRHIFYRVGRTILLLFHPDVTAQGSPNPALPVPPHGAHGPGHVCFSADANELDLWERHLSESGIEIEADFTWPNGARSIYFRDPAGNSLEFAEPRLWE